MKAPALAGALETPGLLLLILGGVLGIFVYLVPAGSLPVGFDPYWNLLVAKTWAESGFPSAMPEAGFTMLARNYADRQLGFHSLLVLLFGSDIDVTVVPPGIWVLAVAQAATVYACVRLLRPGASPLWLVLLPVLSATWMFRATVLRDMLLAVIALLLLVTLLAAKRWNARRGLAVVALTAMFGYVHGAVLLPLVLAALVGLGHWWDGRGMQLGRPALVLAGLLPPLLLRPDFPYSLELLWTLNVRMPLASFTGALPIQPSEFAPPSPRLLLAMSAPFLVFYGLFAYALVRGLSRWAIGLPTLALGAGALIASRLFELAAPFLVIGLGSCRLRLSRPAGAACLVAAVLVTFWRQIPAAARSVRANRDVFLREAGAWLCAHVARGETVFVTDWATTSPLAWWTRGRNLRFTGITDPSLMWAEDPRRFAAWWNIKAARDPDPLHTLTSAFGARTLVVPNNDSAPGRWPGETALYLYRALEAAHRQGRPVISADIGPPGAPRYKCYRFDG